MTIYVNEIVAKLLARYPRANSFWRGALGPEAYVVVQPDGTIKVRIPPPAK